MKTDYLNRMERQERFAEDNSQLLTLDTQKSTFEKNATSVKEVILPSGIDATSYNHLEIFN